MPPAFTLSQDQTLKFISTIPRTKPRNNTSKSSPQTQISRSLQSSHPSTTQAHNQHKTTRPKPSSRTPAAHPTPKHHPNPHQAKATPQNTNETLGSIAIRRQIKPSKSNSYFQKTRYNFQRSTRRLHRPGVLSGNLSTACQPLASANHRPFAVSSANRRRGAAYMPLRHPCLVPF